MSSLTLEQAAQASGRSPREIRLLLEEGRLRGSVLAGRWHVEPTEVDGLVGEVGAASPPGEPQLRVVQPVREAPASGGAVSSGGAAVEELVSRLEQRAIEVARLRGELEALREGRDEHGARVERELGGLRRALAEANAQLERARHRIEELEAGDDPRTEEPAPQPRGAGMSEALSPLFRPS